MNRDSFRHSPFIYIERLAATCELPFRHMSRYIGRIAATSRCETRHGIPVHIFPLIPKERIRAGITVDTVSGTIRAGGRKVARPDVMRAYVCTYAGNGISQDARIRERRSNAVGSFPKLECRYREDPPLLLCLEVPTLASRHDKSRELMWQHNTRKYIEKGHSCFENIVSFNMEILK